MAGFPCPACGKINTNSEGVPFPTDNSRFVRFCFQLRIEAKSVNKKALICYEHFNPKDYIRSAGKIIGVTKTAMPQKQKNVQKDANATAKVGNSSNRPTEMTLDAMLKQTVGIGIPKSTFSSSQPASTSNSNTPTNFNFRSGTSNMRSPEIGIFGFPRSAGTQPSGDMQNNFMGFFPYQNATKPIAKMDELAALVIYRRKMGSSPAVDPKYFKEWLLQSFNLPEKAIKDHSQILNLQDYQVIFLVLDHRQTMENLLTMYRSAPANTYQCVLTPAVTTLREGAHILKKQKGNGQAKEPSLEECLTLLLESTIASNSNGANGAPMPMGLDENSWKNIAAAMMPAYRDLVANANITNPNQLSALANAMSSNYPLNEQQMPSPMANLMQHIDQMTRQGHPANR